jgi:calcium-dependent protein kinase
MSDFVHEMQGNITTEYELIWPSLGKGSFGEVFKAIHIKTGLQRAVKTVSKSKLKVNDQRFL